MTNKLDYLKAKRRIMEVFAPSCDSAVQAKSMDDEEMEATLDAIKSALPFRKPAQIQALSLFLFEGAKRFDRWFTPTPYVVPLNQHERFAKFVNAYFRTESGEPTNSAIFKLHLIRDLVFKEFNERSINTIAPYEVVKFQQQIERIPTPSPAIKTTEFTQHKSELLFILNGLIDKSLRTIFRFRIPYFLHKQPLEVVFTWNGVSMRALITPSFGSTQESFIQTNESVVLSVGASRWQTGSSVVTIEQESLVDGSAYTENLQAIPGHAFPIDGWPKSFTLAFSIFHDIAWRLRTEYAGNQDWIPAPRDLSDLEFWVETNSNTSLGYIKKGSPAELSEIFSPTENSLNISLGELTRLPWSVECRVRADMYLELGDTNEALFWLNVAVESLIAQRFLEIEAAINRPGLADELGSPKEFWSESESIISKQFPEMKGKVKWPSAPIHVSVFAKLKALHRMVPMNSAYDELIDNYRAISGERNDLFHGRRTSRVTVATVEAASQALKWIDTYMWQKPPIESIINV